MASTTGTMRPMDKSCAQRIRPAPAAVTVGAGAVSAAGSVAMRCASVQAIVGSRQADRARVGWDSRARRWRYGFGSLGQIAAEAIIEQVVDGLIDIPIGRKDTSLLQRKTCREDRGALIGADAIMGELSAFAQLLLCDLQRNAGLAGEKLGQGVGVVQRPFAGLLVDLEHLGDGLG